MYYTHIYYLVYFTYIFQKLLPQFSLLVYDSQQLSVCFNSYEKIQIFSIGGHLANELFVREDAVALYLFIVDDTSSTH